MNDKDIKDKFEEDDIDSFEDFEIELNNEKSNDLDKLNVNLNKIKDKDSSLVVEYSIDEEEDEEIEENINSVEMDIEETISDLKEEISEIDIVINENDNIILENEKDTEVNAEEHVISKNEKKETESKEEKFLIKENEPIISFNDVELDYKIETVLKGVNLKIYKGDFVYLVGESGAGKSSLIKMIYREVENTAGTLYIKGENITKLKPKQLPRLRRMIGVVFQDYKLLKDKTIFENVAYTLQVTKYPKNQIKSRVNYILQKVGIEEHADKYPNELSGGQQQRAAIARAIVDEPEILVADEPTGNLDPENALAIMEILETINNEGTTVVMATHDVGIVNNFPKRVVLINDGKVAKESDGEYIYQ